MNDKKSFMNFLDFPLEWLEFGLYPDELFVLQMKNVLANENLSENEIEHRQKLGMGSEHYRYGAFWWVIKNMGYSVLDKLLLAMEKDPDSAMRLTALNELEKLKKYEVCHGFSFDPNMT